MTFVTKIQNFVRNLRLLLENISPRGPPTGAAALCYDGQMTALPPKSYRSILEDLVPRILYTEPRNRRTLERRRMRKHTLPVMETARPKRNIINCLNCGRPHEKETICGFCYLKVSRETNRLKHALGKEKFYFDQPRQEVTYLYKGEEALKDAPKYKGRLLVEVNRKRPSWFSKDLMKKIKGET